MKTENEVVANVFVDPQDPGLPTVDVWLGPSTAPQIWIWVLERGPQVQVFSPRLGSMMLVSGDYPSMLASGPRARVREGAAALLVQAEPFARSVKDFLDEVNRSSAQQSIVPPYPDISQINVDAWFENPTVDIVGRHSGIISMSELQAGKLDLHETGGLNRQLDASLHAESIRRIVADARQIVAASQALSENAQFFLS
jgi:hypothetical protein